MKLRQLKSTNCFVSSLGLGTVKFGRNESVKYPSGFELPSDNEILSLLDLAQEEGINLLDTAPAYGSSEERLGKLLGSRRDDWNIVSKAGEDFANGSSLYDFSPTAIRASVDRTLSRLQTDRIECLLLHSDGNDLDILNHSGAVEELENLKKAGKILSAGISTKTVAGGQRAVALGLDAVMVTYNPWTSEEGEVLDEAGVAGTSVFIKKALASGHFGEGQEPDDPVEWAFRFIYDHPATTSVIVGTINPEHLRQNCASMRRVEEV